MSDTNEKKQLPKLPMFRNPNEPVDREALQRLEDKLIAMGSVKVTGTGATRIIIPMHKPAKLGVVYGQQQQKTPEEDKEK